MSRVRLYFDLYGQRPAGNAYGVHRKWSHGFRGTRLTLSAESGATIYYTADGSNSAASGNAAVASGTEVILDGTPGAQITCGLRQRWRINPPARR
ncbi:MAG: chitobiase/beta-hexosaminidase C-terminal domain-containing protein [Eubacteriales bacterium]